MFSKIEMDLVFLQKNVTNNPHCSDLFSYQIKLFPNKIMCSQCDLKHRIIIFVTYVMNMQEKSLNLVVSS